MTPAELPLPPAAPRIPSRLTLHGVTLADSYAWMRDPASPALARYLTAERAYYDAQSSHLAGLISDLYNEAAGRTPDQADDSAGWPAGEFTYRTRIPAGQQNRQFLRSRAVPAAAPGDPAEQLLLDENILAEGHDYFAVGTAVVSPDHAVLAYGTDTDLVRRVLMDVAAKSDLVLDAPKPEVRLEDFADSSLSFALFCWIPNARDDLRVSSALRFAIEKAFRQSSIEIPFPQREIRLKTPSP